MTNPKENKLETGHVGNAPHSLFICKYCEETIGGCSCKAKKKVDGLGVCYKCGRGIVLKEGK